jgi:tetratricopeptide (TPR) repeat protein
MAGSRSPVPQSSGVVPSSPMTSGSLLKRWKLVLWTLAASVLLEIQAGISAGTENSRVGIGVSSMSEAHSGSLLGEYFRDFLAKRDVDEFRNRVSARYNEGTLGRILAGSTDVSARRAAVLSLGIFGSFDQSNAALGRALRDEDLAVRSMAEDALWAVWFRAGTPAHNRALEELRNAISQSRELVREQRTEQLNKAEALATRLIADAPGFAEAYNQRAIIYFIQGRYFESAEDCQRVIERNPFHIGAIEGLAQCQLNLNRRRDALKSLRRALKLRPHNSSLRESIHELEKNSE